MESPEQNSWRLARNIAVALALAVVALWFLHQIVGMILLMICIGILAIVINAGVSWLQRKGWKRGIATGVVMLVTVGIMVGVFWLVIPRLIEQGSQLAAGLPDLVQRLQSNLAPILSEHPGLADELSLDALDPSRFIGSLPSVLGSIGRMSLSLLGSLVLMILVVSTVIYIVLAPKPILAFYLWLFPKEKREAAEAAFIEGSDSVVGWIWANVIIGFGEAVVTTIFLSMMGIPGAFVWGVLVFFAELIPRVGGYIMALPPVLVALAVDPMTAVWIALYFVVMNIIGGDVIAPRIRSNMMSLHPAFLMVMMLAMATAFGILGAILATPVAGFVSAFYTHFVMTKKPHDETIPVRVDRMLHMQAADGETAA